MIDFISLSNCVLQPVQAMEYAGYDPFDSLNSRLIENTPLGSSELVRLVWLQLGKRSPINFRPLVGVPRLRNPKGIGLFILGMLDDYKRTREQCYLEEATQLADWLLTQQSDQTEWDHPCWGYHFDWQARAFYVPKGKPNIITTCYVSRALYGLGKQLERDDYVEVALDSARFIHKHLLTKENARTFFAYIPGESAFVHNASLWGAAWVATAGVEMKDSRLQESAIKVARQSVKEQREDGSWVYGARHHHQFVDGFHTGYNLEALDYLRKSLGISEFDESIERGMTYYRDNFFLKDGTAKYYSNSVYPLDMHNFTQGVLTLLKVGGSETDITLAEKVMHRAIETMYLPKQGRFIYQKHRWYTNKINYIRWTQAWAYYGLSFMNRYMAEYRNETN